MFLFLAALLLVPSVCSAVKVHSIDANEGTILVQQESNSKTVSVSSKPNRAPARDSEEILSRLNQALAGTLSLAGATLGPRQDSAPEIQEMPKRIPGVDVAVFVEGCRH